MLSDTVQHIRDYFDGKYDFELYNEKTNIETRIRNSDDVFETIENSDQGFFVRILSKNQIGFFSSSGDPYFEIPNALNSILLFPDINNLRFSDNNNFINHGQNFDISIESIQEYLYDLFPKIKFDIYIVKISKNMNLVTKDSFIDNHMKFIKILLIDKKNNLEHVCITDANYKEDIGKHLLYKIIKKNYNLQSYKYLEISQQAYGHLIQAFIRQKLFDKSQETNIPKDLIIFDDGDQNMLTQYPFYDYEGIKRAKTNIICGGKWYNNLTDLSEAQNKASSGNAFRRHYQYLPTVEPYCITHLISQDKFEKNTGKIIRIVKFFDSYSNFSLYTGDYYGKCLINLTSETDECVVTDIKFNLYQLLNSIEGYGANKVCNRSHTNMPSLIVSTKLFEISQE
jgi:Predicted Zn-dependent proteases and their inactivated homologs